MPPRARRLFSISCGNARQSSLSKSWTGASTYWTKRNAKRPCKPSAPIFFGLISPCHAAATPHGSDRDPCTFAAVPNACRHERMIPPGHRAADVFERCGIKICLLAGGRSSPHRPNGQNDAIRRCCLGCCGSNSCGLTSVGVPPPPIAPFQWPRHTSALRSPRSFCCCHS